MSIPDQEGDFIPDEGLPALAVLAFVYKDIQWLKDNGLAKSKTDARSDPRKKLMSTDFSTMYSSPKLPHEKVDLELLGLASNFDLPTELENPEYLFDNDENVSLNVMDATESLDVGFCKSAKLEMSLDSPHEQKVYRRRLPLIICNKSGISLLCGRMNVSHDSTHFSLSSAIKAIMQSSKSDFKIDLQYAGRKILLSQILNVDILDADSIHVTINSRDTSIWQKEYNMRY